MKRNRFALITGASGGLGKTFADKLASENYNLILADMDEKGLLKVSSGLTEKYDIDVKTYPIDLTDEEQIKAFANRLKNMKHIEMLVNCAGFGEGAKFYKENIERQLKMIKLHITATVYLVHAVLPEMIKQKKGDIITVSSLAAFIPSPGSSIYASSKAFLNSFMESIHMEVHRYGIRVQSLCPGLTRTGFHSKLESEGKRSKLNKTTPQMDAEEVVRLSLKCLNKGKVVCIPGCYNKTIKKAIPVLPRRSFYSLSEKIAGKNL